MEPFTQIKNSLIRANKSALDVYQKSVLNVLLSYGSCEKIFLGQQRLADESGMSRDKVIDVVKNLKTKRYISTEIQPDRSTLAYKLLSKAVVAVGDKPVADSDKPVADSDRGCGCGRQGVVAVGDTSNKSISNKNRVIKDKGVKKALKEVLPDWLNKEAWAGWVQHRKELKKTLTPSTIKLQLKMLEKNNGDHVAIINQSIEKGWTGLFKVEHSPPHDQGMTTLLTEQEREDIKNENPFNSPYVDGYKP